MGTGACVAEIAIALESSVGTVNQHIRRAQQRAGLEHRYQLMAYIQQHPKAFELALFERLPVAPVGGDTEA